MVFWACPLSHKPYLRIMSLAILHHLDFQAVIADGHRFPMGKYGLIARFLIEDGLLAPEDFIVPDPIEFDQACYAHWADYVGQVFHANLDPAITKDIGFAVNESVAMRARLSSGATLLAGKIALDIGIATSTAGGSHHARRSQGAGFCVINDVAIAAKNLIASGDAKHIMIFDCDVHQGDGTADIFKSDASVTTISIHNEKNYPTRKIASDLDIGLEDNLGDAAYLEIIDATLHRALEYTKPDLVFYNAGVDPHHKDRLGRLSLSDDGLRLRDRAVIKHFRERNIPIAAVQGGGYSYDVEELARRHTIIHHVAAEFA